MSAKSFITLVQYFLSNFLKLRHFCLKNDREIYVICSLTDFPGLCGAQMVFIIYCPKSYRPIFKLNTSYKQIGWINLIGTALHMHMHIHMHTHTHTHIHTDRHTCIYITHIARTHTYVNIYLCVRVRVCIYIYITHTHTHTHTHTYIYICVCKYKLVCA
jgi:hypothetical protein